MREDPDGERPRGRMKRLSSGWYRGQAFVHWTFTVKDRRTGWLDTAFHARFRELHLHTLARYRLLAMSYCLMSDHLHLLWGGLANDSDQDRAASFLHKYLGRLFDERGLALQKQAWDVVLRAKDRERDALMKVAFYIGENPVRAGLTATAAEWPYSGAQAAGYPDMDWRLHDYQDRVWTVAHAESQKYGGWSKEGSGPASGAGDAGRG